MANLYPHFYFNQLYVVVLIIQNSDCVIMVHGIKANVYEACWL